MMQENLFEYLIYNFTASFSLAVLFSGVFSSCGGKIMWTF